MSSSGLSLFVGVDIIHRLSVAVRLFDIFTGETVRSPLKVTIPDLRLEAFRAASDSTYRFVITNGDVPTGGPFDIQVEIPSGEYEARDPARPAPPSPRCSC